MNVNKKGKVDHVKIILTKGEYRKEK
ncbi:Protein of unknown function [Bacillus wiedmannii]|nr:Protein of unknown function [Bacillus wiedmannii]